MSGVAYIIALVAFLLALGAYIWMQNKKRRQSILISPAAMRSGWVSSLPNCRTTREGGLKFPIPGVRSPCSKNNNDISGRWRDVHLFHIRQHRLELRASVLESIFLKHFTAWWHGIAAPTSRYLSTILDPNAYAISKSRRPKPCRYFTRVCSAARYVSVLCLLDPF